MKTIGLIGGMAWESSIEYYRLINEAAMKKLGGYHSAKSLMISVDFAEVEAFQMQGKWEEAGNLLADAAKSLERGGADFVVLCTNTMHKGAGAIQANISIPFLHIADATAEAIGKAGMHKIGLLGTRFTMEEDFYKGRLTEKFGLEVVVPDASGRKVVNDVIYQELGFGIIRQESREQYIRVIEQMAAQGAEGVILGCTEIGLLVHQEDSPIPVFDTTRIHAEVAFDYAIAG